MSIQQTMLSGGLGPGLTVIVSGPFTSNYYGFAQSGTNGAIVPYNPVLSGGTGAIGSLYSSAGSVDLVLNVLATYSGTKTSAFTNLSVVDSTGTTRNYTSASATYSTSSGAARWAWGTGSNPVWTSTYQSPIAFT